MNEDWLTRGVKNVAGLPRPVPYEVDLQQNLTFIRVVEWLHSDTLAALATDARMARLDSFIVESSSIFVKLCYAGLFSVVLLIILTLSVRAGLSRGRHRGGHANHTGRPANTGNL